jgi:4-hydroxy-2-oxovalerate aldolase
MNQFPDTREQDVRILECTLRDGSYAINFQFSAKDTAVIALSLEQAGIRHIEIGHGLGLNASRTGKGVAAEGDENYMRAVKSKLKHAKWGMFCIPGIARLDNLLLGRDYEMGFVRIGVHSTNFSEAAPFVDLAKKSGIQVFINLMKSYMIEAEEFGRFARHAQDMGADGLYLVDSAGYMLPEQVEEYLLQARQSSDLALGFHGHDNLRLSVANALRAVDSGAQWIDATLQGIGRSSGNPPTESLAAILSRRGHFAVSDLLLLLRIGRKHIWPLLRAQGCDSMEIVSGLAGFHSGFEADVLAVSRREKVSPLAMVLKLCEQTKAGAPEDLLTRLAEEIRESQSSTQDIVLPAHALAPLTLDTSPDLDDVLARISSLAKKNNAISALNVLVNSGLDVGRRMSHVVYEYSDVVFGSVEVRDEGNAVETLRQAKGKVQFFLLDGKVFANGTATLAHAAREILDHFEILEYHDDGVLLRSILGQLQGILCGLSGKRVLVHGAAGLGNRLIDELRTHRVAVFQGDSPAGGPDVDRQTLVREAAACDALVVLDAMDDSFVQLFLEHAAAPIVFEASVGRMDLAHIRAIRKRGIPVYRPDMRGAMVSELRMLLAYRRNYHGTMPTRMLDDIRLVSHGFIGDKGDIVVDNASDPKHVFGIADGYGRTIHPHEEAELISRVEALLFSEYHGGW